MSFDERGCGAADAYTSTNSASATTHGATQRTKKQGKRFKSKERKAPAALPPFPSVDVIKKVKAQFFDNGAENSKQGKSRYTLRIDALEAEQAFNDDVHWWRIVQLISPDTVSSWVLRQHKAGELTDEIALRYGAVIEAAAISEAAGDTVWMGHIYTPPGTTYIIGQFVLARMTQDGALTATLYVDGDQIDFAGFRKQKKENCHYKAAKLWCVVEAE
jgi:hypothetical protein